MIENQRKKIYLDTSVISALFDERTPERVEETTDFWLLLQSGEYDVCVSDVTVFEINKCTDPKRLQLMEALTDLDYQLLDETEGSLELTEKYLSFGVLTEKSRDDCRHIAIASLNRCDYIASWNFKHFVNVKTIDKVQGVNKILGLGGVNILPPAMFLEGDDSDE